MFYKTSDKLIAYLALISGLSISAVAIYYSVAGLMAIFAAAVIPIMIMGVVLEVGKLAATVWLKQNWQRAPKFLKTYLLLAILVLMLLTSMGIFGYLSKAHLDQAVPTGDVAAKVSILDEKIKTERDNIETARTAIKQMDAQVDARLSRSDDEKGAERAVQIRRQQQAERGRLQKEIGEAQTRIAKLNEERAPIASELRKVEAEVGPIKYIAALIYGDQADQNLLEKAVRWVIIVIVLVFDPLAVILLLASQYSFTWFREQEHQYPTIADLDRDVGEPPTEEEMASDLHELNNMPEPEITETKYKTSFWPFPTPHFVWKEEIKSEENSPVEQTEVESKDENKDIPTNDDLDIDEKSALDEWNKMIQEAEREVEREKEKSAKQQWKEDHPDGTIKHQEKLKDLGIIDVLPWEIAKAAADSKYQIFPELHSETSKPEPDFPKEDRIKPDLTEVIEPDSSKKKNYIVKEQTQQIKKTRN